MRQVKTTARLYPGCSLASSHTPANHKRRYRQQLKIGVSGSSMMKQNIEIYLADAPPYTRVVLVHGISVAEFFLILAEFGHSDRNGGILCKKRKNSAQIGMVGSYVVSLSKIMVALYFWTD